MFQDSKIETPPSYDNVSLKSQQINFTMPSDIQTGALLRTLVASKPAGNFLDIGTGTGLSLSWIADGADALASITTLDNNLQYQEIARSEFENDDRITFVCEDGENWLRNYKGKKFDVIFADAWPGKCTALDETLICLNVGGFYLIDDLLPQPNWPENHQENVDRLMFQLKSRKDLSGIALDCSTGLYLFTKLSDQIKDIIS